MRYFTPDPMKKMKVPGEMDIPTEPGRTLDMLDPAKASMRMKNICASPEEIELYKFDPNGARRNENPAIPIEDYNSTILGD